MQSADSRHAKCGSPHDDAGVDADTDQHQWRAPFVRRPPSSRVADRRARSVVWCASARRQTAAGVPQRAWPTPSSAYNVFGTVRWEQLPLFAANKAIAVDEPRDCSHVATRRRPPSAQGAGSHGARTRNRARASVVRRARSRIPGSQSRQRPASLGRGGLDIAGALADRAAVWLGYRPRSSRSSARAARSACCRESHA